MDECGTRVLSEPRNGLRPGQPRALRPRSRRLRRQPVYSAVADSILGPCLGTYTERMSDPDLSTVTFPRRIAVVNRGEAAVRLIRAVRELNAEYGCGITTIALHTDAERRAMFVRQADEAVTLRKTSAGIVVPRPRRARTRSAGVQGRRGVGGLGFRRRRHRLRRALRAPEAHVHRAAPRRDADTGRQGRGQTAGREGGRSARTVERWPRRDPRGRPPSRRGHRLPADHQGP